MATAATITSGMNNRKAGVPLAEGYKLAFVNFTTVGADSYTFSVNGIPSGGICIDTTNLAPRAVSISGSTITVATCSGTANHVCIIWAQ